MLSLITALIASAAPVPPSATAAAPLPILLDDDQRRDELRAEAREIERMIEELHERLGRIEHEMEELDGHHDEHHEDHHGEERRERRVIVMGLGDEDGRQIMIDGEHSELIERLVEDLMEDEGRHEDDHHGDHDDHDGHHGDEDHEHHDEHLEMALDALGLEGGMIFVGHDDEDDHGHHEVRRFEFPGGHGEVHIRMEMEDEMDIDLEEILEEVGIHGHDLGGREIHMEVEIETEGDHGEEGEHHERHVERRVIHVGGDEERDTRRRGRRLPLGGLVEIEAMETDDIGRLIFEAGPTGIDVIEPQRRRARDRGRDMRRGEDMPREGMGREMGPRGGGRLLPEAMGAIRELREEVRAMRREMNEMRRRLDRR